MLIFRSLPFGVVFVLLPIHFIRCFALDLDVATVKEAKREYLIAGLRSGKSEEEEEMAGRQKSEVRSQKSEDVDAQVTLEDLARIASKTEPVLGVNEKLSEHDAVVMMVRRLRRHDPGIIDRNIRRTLPKEKISAEFGVRSAESRGSAEFGVRSAESGGKR